MGTDPVRRDLAAGGERLASARAWVFPLMGAGITIILALIILWSVGLPDPATLLALEPPQPGERPVAPVVGGLAPPFSATAADGWSLTLTALRGSPVILNFWATWCGPCAVEMPDLQRVYQARRAEGLRVLAVNVDEPPEVFLPWAAARGLTFDLLPDPGRAIQMLYQLRGVPQTILVDADGVIREIFYGLVNMDRLRSRLDALP